jgi:hypothetical protein
MKVRITTELSSADRLMIGAIQYGKLGKLASHEDCVGYLERVTESALEPSRLAWQRQTDEILAQIIGSPATDG